MIVIENLEKYSEWLIIEYKNAFSLVGNELLITNVKDEKIKEALSKIGVRFDERSVREILDELPRPWVVLDPKASRRLEPQEAKGAIIVGGILGSHPPRGRTWIELTSRLPKEVLARNIGEGQFSIDGAAAVAYMVSKGMKVEDIKVIKGLKLKLARIMGMELEEELPYWYPLVDGKPFISDELIEYLKRRPLGDP